MNTPSDIHFLQPGLVVTISEQRGVVKFPQLITIYPDHPELASNIESWQLLSRFEKPVLTLFGNKDPISRGFEKELQAHIPGCKGQDHRILKGVGHFSPEEAPDELTACLLDFIKKSGTDHDFSTG